MWPGVCAPCGTLSTLLIPARTSRQSRTSPPAQAGSFDGLQDTRHWFRVHGGNFPLAGRHRRHRPRGPTTFGLRRRRRHVLDDHHGMRPGAPAAEPPDRPRLLLRRTGASTPKCGYSVSVIATMTNPSRSAQQPVTARPPRPRGHPLLRAVREGTGPPVPHRRDRAAQVRPAPGAAVTTRPSNLTRGFTGRSERQERPTRVTGPMKRGPRRSVLLRTL
jgi:hypothetical protein